MRYVAVTAGGDMAAGHAGWELDSPVARYRVQAGHAANCSARQLPGALEPVLTLRQRSQTTCASTTSKVPGIWLRRPLDGQVH
eukprot:862689-Pleurochrysis_carterae.AAC.6